MAWTWGIAIAVAFSTAFWALVLLMLRRLMEGHW